VLQSPPFHTPSSILVDPEEVGPGVGFHTTYTPWPTPLTLLKWSWMSVSPHDVCCVTKCGPTYMRTKPTLYLVLGLAGLVQVDLLLLAPSASSNAIHTALFPLMEPIPNSLVVTDVSLMSVIPKCGNNVCEVRPCLSSPPFSIPSSTSPLPFMPITTTVCATTSVW
jgi:hypothetical protein